MKTIHRIFFKNSSDMSEVESESVDLLITSPPYPMIEMWDSMFSSINEDIRIAFQNQDGKLAFSLIHKELDKVWKESTRVVKTGGIACINIGDATRTINKKFQLFTNHVRISDFFQQNGFIVLPCILWRKPTNSPNKFMGSGMLPPNAYVTLEHEYILIFRKGEENKKIPPKSENRYNSAYFWEERNKWFSDVWADIKGISQSLNNNNNNKLRERSAAFPSDLPYRLVNMFSNYGDTILDPFWGTGTTTLASMVCARNSIGYELNAEFMEIFKRNVKDIKKVSNSINEERIKNHLGFIKKYTTEGSETKYTANNYGFPVITQQEKNILFYSINNIREIDKIFELEYDIFKIEQKNKLVQSRLIL